MITLSQKSLTQLLMALAIYLTSLLAANTLGLKIMPFLFGSHLSVAVFSFPVVFLSTDVIGEVYGRKMSKLFVRAGFASTALFIGFSLISVLMPWSQDGLWAKESYNQIFGTSARIAIASLVAFLVAELQDVFSFFLLKEKLGIKRFWIRSWISNIWSQFLDSALFMLIAFAGIYSWKTLFSIVITWWLYKVAMGILYTPLSYVGLRLLKDTANENK